jgi:hypothetical protein
VVKLGRGELFEALGMLSFFREQVLGPMLFRRANLPQRGVLKEALGIDPDGLLTSTLATTIVTLSGLPFEGLLTLMSLCGLMRCLTILQTMRRVGRFLPCWTRILTGVNLSLRPLTRPKLKNCAVCEGLNLRGGGAGNGKRETTELFRWAINGLKVRI